MRALFWILLAVGYVVALATTAGGVVVATLVTLVPVAILESYTFRQTREWKRPARIKPWVRVTVYAVCLMAVSVYETPTTIAVSREVRPLEERFVKAAVTEGPQEADTELYRPDGTYIEPTYEIYDLVTTRNGIFEKHHCLLIWGGWWANDDGSSTINYLYARVPWA